MGIMCQESKPVEVWDLDITHSVGRVRKRSEYRAGTLVEIVNVVYHLISLGSSRELIVIP